MKNIEEPRNLESKFLIYRLLGTYILKDFFARFLARFLTRYLTRFLPRLLLRFLTRNTVLQFYRDRKYSVQFF